MVVQPGGGGTLVEHGALSGGLEGVQVGNGQTGMRLAREDGWHGNLET